MPNLTELTAQIITARAAKKEMSTEEFQQEMQIIYSFLKGVEEGNVPPSTQAQPEEEPAPQKINFKQYFKKDEVICLICNKSFKTLKRHLAKAHNLKTGEYRKQFSIPAKYNLVATAYSEQRKKDALDRGQADILARARAVRAAKNAAASEAKIKSPAAVVKEKTPTPPAKKSTAAPAAKAKAATPVKKVKATKK